MARKYKKMNDIEIAVAREQYVVRANAMVQKSRFDLSFAEQRAVMYAISLIQPNRDELTYEFDIREYARVCGLDEDAGKVYEDTRSLLQGLRDRSWWLEQEDGSEVTVAWFNKIRMTRSRGKVLVEFDRDMMPYILDILDNYTQYRLMNTLAMKSVYSVRVYELLISHSWRSKQRAGKTGDAVFTRETFEIDELKKRLNAHKTKSYANFYDFKKRVLEVAKQEINQYTDIEIDYTPIKKGNKVIKIEFLIKYKGQGDRISAMNEVSSTLDN